MTQPDQDLKTIQNAPRISADPSAVTYMKKYIVFNGDLDIPVLTMHTTATRWCSCRRNKPTRASTRGR